MDLSNQADAMRAMYMHAGCTQVLHNIRTAWIVYFMHGFILARIDIGINGHEKETKLFQLAAPALPDREGER